MKLIDKTCEDLVLEAQKARVWSYFEGKFQSFTNCIVKKETLTGLRNFNMGVLRLHLRNF